MLMGMLSLLLIATVPVFRGDLRKLATLELSATWLLPVALGLQVLFLITLTDAPLHPPAPARAVIVLFGLHVIAIGNVLPRLRPGWPGRAAIDDRRYVAWQRIARTAGYLAVVTIRSVVPPGPPSLARKPHSI